MNRKGDSGDFLMFFSFLLLLIFVAGGIAGGVGLFYGDEYDFREVESALLANKVGECLSDNSEELDFVLTEQGFYDICGIEKNVIGADLGIKVCVDSVDCYGDKSARFQTRSNFEQCSLNIGGNRAFGVCSDLKVVLDGSVVDIIGFSNQRKEVVLG